MLLCQRFIRTDDDWCGNFGGPGEGEWKLVKADVRLIFGMRSEHDRYRITVHGTGTFAMYKEFKTKDEAVAEFNSFQEPLDIKHLMRKDYDRNLE